MELKDEIENNLLLKSATLRRCNLTCGALVGKRIPHFHFFFPTRNLIGLVVGFWFLGFRRNVITLRNVYIVEITFSNMVIYQLKNS
ncbi:MAG: hypothetical protein EVJ46_05045 [Candidatus Acididesulfobacter guangdongensis]|uniref:Uncharacterized protein n=1 Tax=Acididesulfobacter guangdongensis TaxID=2597225 RepID=A0A519BGJ8_ACIG2|nr:MAG: hypothetical protein EVJ46_05045 [Candidatus Acididesulfobacter guangdongensis]